jgi:hypothetical protein
LPNYKIIRNYEGNLVARCSARVIQADRFPQDCEGVVNSGEKGLVLPNPFFMPKIDLHL